MRSVYSSRPARPEDFEIICTFPLDVQEAFAMYPSGVYPLTGEQLSSAAAARRLPTVVTDEAGHIAGYANLYGVEEGVRGWLGNVIVAPAYRGTGAAEALIRAMMELAKTELGLPKLQLACHNTNTRGLLFYHKLGFVPFGLKPMNNHLGQPIACMLMEIEL